MNVQVVTVVNRVPKEPYYHYVEFLTSLQRFGAPPVILGKDEKWQGLMTKPRRLRQWLRSGACTADLLIVTDAFDVIFAAPPDEVAQEIMRHFGAPGSNLPMPVVFNAEKGLFPRGELAHRFPETGTPWRYLNSGLFVGKPAMILGLLEAMWLDDIHDDHKAEDNLHGTNPGDWVNPNDQGWYQTMFAAQPVDMVLDSGCRVFQCLSGCAVEDFDLEFHPHRVLNRVTGTTPLVWHFNGGAKNDLMPVFLRKWGIRA